MTLKFEGEVLNIGGFELTGTVLVWAVRRPDYFGSEFGDELDFNPDGFVLDVSQPGDLKLNDSLVEKAVDAWIYGHERQIMAAYEKAAKAGD